MFTYSVYCYGPEATESHKLECVTLQYALDYAKEMWLSARPENQEVVIHKCSARTYEYISTIWRNGVSPVNVTDFGLSPVRNIGATPMAVNVVIHQEDCL